MRLINADELITAFPCGESIRTESVRATIKNMPAIEVSEDAISNGVTSPDYIKGYREAVQRLEKFYLGEAKARNIVPKPKENE